MSIIHCCNTFFEWELQHTDPVHLSEAFAQHLIFRQLQFLPLLYANKGEGVVCSALPCDPAGYAAQKLYLFSDPIPMPCRMDSWGPSRLLAAWAKKRGIDYRIPSWEMVREIHSKQFSFVHSPRLRDATLLHCWQDAASWLKAVLGPKVLKTCFGSSGRGHLIVDESVPLKRVEGFLQKEWQKGLPVIAEPWVQRRLDFSTQWYIDEQIHYLGATLCKNTTRGQYAGSCSGKESLLFGEYLPYLKEHKAIAQELLQEIKHRGWFGNIGVDAFLYEAEGLQLHPVVEINARKTMGWVALQLQQRNFPDEILTLSYENSASGYLPQALECGVRFAKNLQLKSQKCTTLQIRDWYK